jgi:hypothetical protein
MLGEKKFFLGIAVVTILVFVVILVSSNKQNERANTPLAGEEQPVQSSIHVSRGRVEQMQDPPTSGDHYGDRVAGPGIHDKPVEDGLTVHSMEHGAVVLHYDPVQLSEEAQKQLKDFFKTELSGKKIMLPRENMSSPIILTSWGQILKLEEVQQDTIKTFFETNDDRGPEKVASY